MTRFGEIARSTAVRIDDLLFHARQARADGFRLGGVALNGISRVGSSPTSGIAAFIRCLNRARIHRHHGVLLSVASSASYNSRVRLRNTSRSISPASTFASSACWAWYCLFSMPARL